MTPGRPRGHWLPKAAKLMACISAPLCPYQQLKLGVGMRAGAWLRPSGGLERVEHLRTFRGLLWAGGLLLGWPARALPFTPPLEQGDEEQTC